MKKKKTYKRLTRKDYKRLIGIANGKEKRKKSKAERKWGEKVVKEVALLFQICC